MKPARVAIYYPPMRRGGEVPLLPQNRQFKFSKSAEIRIYPVVMSSLATMLKRAGHDVLFLDGINFRLAQSACDAQLRAFAPDFLVMETKAPVFDRHLALVRELKSQLACGVILCGDHVCFFPENAVAGGADYAVSSGDYDFVITELIGHLREGGGAMPGGVWYGQEDRPVSSGESADYDLDEAPLIDRELTRWDCYGEAYLHRPTAYIMSGRGCGGANRNTASYESSSPGVCSFCVWQHAFWKCGAKMRAPGAVAEEVELLVRRYGVREIFDDNDSGGTWNEKWLEDFYRELDARKLIGKFYISSNARADSLSRERVALLRRLGFRLLKVGLESGNDNTLELLQKNESIAQIEEGVRNAKDAGLRVLMTTMVGYPWEEEADARRTYEVTRGLMLYKTHFGDSLQSSIITPYPGTPLFRLAEQRGWLTEAAADYANYDMNHHILKTQIDTVYWCHKMWAIHLHPLFLLKSLLSVRSIDDLRLGWRGLLSLFGHLRDYERAEAGKTE